MQKLLIVGLGDVAQRVLMALYAQWQICALTRSAVAVPMHAHIQGCTLDLDADEFSDEQLAMLTQDYDAVLWTAPPRALADVADTTLDGAVERPASGMPRMARMARMAQIWGEHSEQFRPKRMVYISTSGVYGDCAGAWVDELCALRPESRRALARVEDEAVWTQLGADLGAQVSILRAPGIYALERLPLSSVLAAAPVMREDEDSYSNHIHADDLAGAVVHALCRDESTLTAQVQTPRILNICDDEPLLMGEWMGALAQVLGMDAPRRIGRAEMMASVGAMRWSFMRESRRLRNDAMKSWGYELRHPSAVAFVRTHADEIRAHVEQLIKDGKHV